MRQTSLFNQLVNLEWILLLAIVVVGVFLRGLAQSHFRFISPDGVAYINHVLRFLEGEGNLERRGPFFQLLLMVSYRMTGQVSFESSILVPQFFGCVIPILLFLLGKRFFDSKTGLIAALLGSLNPLLINLSCWVLRETLSLALILTLILTAHITLGVRSKRKSLLATLIPGFLSGLIILTREEKLIIPPAYIIYIFFTEKRRRDFLIRSCIFLITTLFTITPWLLYSNAHFGDPFYGYLYYVKLVTGGLGSAPGTEATSEMQVFQKGLSWILFGLWKEILELPAVFSLFGFVFLPIGIIFTIRKRAVWIVYLILGLDLLILTPLLYGPGPYELPMLFPDRWNDVNRIIFSGVMPANVIVAYGIVKLTSLLSNKER